MKKIVSLVLACAMALSLAACGNGNNSSNPPANSGNTSGGSNAPSASGGGSTSQETIVLKFSDCHSPTATNHLALQRMAEEIKNQTNGRIEVEVYPSSQLGDVKPSMEAIQMNTLDMAISNLAVLGSVVPECAVISAPFMFESDDQVANALNGALGEALNEKAAAQNINIVCWLPTGFRNVYSTKSIKTIDDLKGLKIRTMENDLDMATFNTLGAIATPMAYGDVFTGLQQNTIDAAENTLANIVSDGFTEVATCVALTNHYYNVCPILMSNSALEKIPADLRDTFLKACVDGAEAGRQLIMEENDKAIETMEAAGIEVNEMDMDALQAATASLYDEFSDRLPADLVEMAKSAEK